MNWEAAILWFVTFVLSTTVHEAAHATFAMLGGDRTALEGGQVTLNPLPHMQREPFGMVMLPLLSLWMSGANWCFGYASTPYNPIWAYRHPKRAALMSAAGPLANVLLAAIAFAVLYFVGRPDGGTEEAVRRIAGTFLLLNLLLAVFNLIPLPPLDGAGVVQGLLPKTRGLYETIQRIPYAGIVTFVLLIKILPYLFWPVYSTVNGWLPYPYRG
ncbi:MAG: site-2 protease family protein [Planctomycetes bacterium]|nr:site-2 protease family protein [Planctomycetota bacterium]MCB9886263.1 site-2 protease family protein [Planctomycetota bacterium]